MWRHRLQNEWILIAGSVLPLILSYAPIHLVPAVFVCGIFLVGITQNVFGFKKGFKRGFIASFFLMLGGFYWVTYVIHEFGYLSWPVSALLFLGFCIIGALNWPIFVGLAAQCQSFSSFKKKSSRTLAIWFTLGIPSLYTLVEYLIPKLFPWLLGYAFYTWPLLTQICELTGPWSLSFAILSLGGAIAHRWLFSRKTRLIWLVPCLTWISIVGWGFYHLYFSSRPPTQSFHVAVVQANIGSLEKVQAEKGILDRVKHVLDRYIALTDPLVFKSPRPDLIVWPETAMPFALNQDSVFSNLVRAKVLKWNIPLLTGGYEQEPSGRRDFNAAFLMEPVQGSIRIQTYEKNILLAFGEYMPFGEWFPSLYETFPQVSNFARGTTQKALTLQNGIKIGVSICYEAIVPEFFHNIAQERPHLFINITNDSWFGPTSEPFQHAQLSALRSIEYRTPMVRSTNTGTSLVVDWDGKISHQTPIFQPTTFVARVDVPISPQATLYLRYGSWFIILMFVGFLFSLILLVRKS